MSLNCVDNENSVIKNAELIRNKSLQTNSAFLFQI
jgi:hypothetical protein